MVRTGYDTAQICLNGDVITRSFHDQPHFRADYCSECGASIIIACEACRSEIRGSLRGVLSAHYSRPSFCPDCGDPYPWIAISQAAFRELVEETDDLSDQEKALLSSSFDDLITDTPRAKVAVIRMKKSLPRLGQEIGGAMRSILVDVATAAAKQQMGL